MKLLTLRLIAPENYERDLAAMERDFAAPLAIFWSAAGRKQCGASAHLS